jgi:hypothetical protein
VFLAHTQLDYARLLGPRDPRAQSLIEEAADSAERLQLPAVARRAAGLRR